MRNTIVAGNWKMNGSLELIRDYAPKVAEGLRGESDADVLVFPPSVYLTAALEKFGESSVTVGAQNLSSYESGAYTGEWSAAMLVDLGVTTVLVGHSERRALFGETNDVVADKAKIALEHGLVPIICVGETLEERESGQAEKCVEAQLKAVLDAVELSNPAALVVAYEPVWAIGTGKTASPAQAQAMHEFIRECMRGYSESLAEGCRILYGGSVNAGNAEELFAQADIDGGLVGGASLKADEFLNICRCLG